MFFEIWKNVKYVFSNTGLCIRNTERIIKFCHIRQSYHINKSASHLFANHCVYTTSWGNDVNKDFNAKDQVQDFYSKTKARTRIYVPYRIVLILNKDKNKDFSHTISLRAKTKKYTLLKTRYLNAITTVSTETMTHIHTMWLHNEATWHGAIKEPSGYMQKLDLFTIVHWPIR